MLGLFITRAARPPTRSGVDIVLVLVVHLVAEGIFFVVVVHRALVGAVVMIKVYGQSVRQIHLGEIKLTLIIVLLDVHLKAGTFADRLLPRYDWEGISTKVACPLP